MFRSLTRRQVLFDTALAVVAFVAAVFWTLNAGSLGWGLLYDRMTLLQAVAVTAVLCGALGVRRLSPGLALGVAWIAALAQMALGLPPIPGNLAILGILYTTAAYGTKLTMWLGFASAFVGATFVSLYLIVPPLIRGGWTWEDAVVEYLGTGVAVWVAATLGLLLSWVVGALARTALRARENRRGRERAEAEAIAEQERVRIARDMHDVVAHSLAVVIAQADGARYASAADPDAASAALTTISQTARSALSDVRLLLTQLRHSQGDGPQPTLADLEELYAQVRAAGVELRIDVDPAPPGVPPAAVQLAVYRILQEALTNALRHGGAGAVSVRLAWHPDRVDLEVRNPSAARVGTPGHGLIGMSERASLIGGTLTASVDGSDFVVSGRLPVGAVVA